MKGSVLIHMHTKWLKQYPCSGNELKYITDHNSVIFFFFFWTIAGFPASTMLFLSFKLYWVPLIHSLGMLDKQPNHWPIPPTSVFNCVGGTESPATSDVASTWWSLLCLMLQFFSQQGWGLWSWRPQELGVCLSIPSSFSSTFSSFLAFSIKLLYQVS